MMKQVMLIIVMVMKTTMTAVMIMRMRMMMVMVVMMMMTIAVVLRDGGSDGHEDDVASGLHEQAGYAMCRSRLKFHKGSTLTPRP